MGKIVIERSEDKHDKMIFIMTKDKHPILVTWNWPFGDFVELIKKDKYLRFYQAAFITDWDVATGHYISDDIGWTELILDSTEIKWIVPVK